MMVDFLLRHFQWIFSGIGTSILILLLSRKAITKSNNRKSLQSAPTPPSNSKKEEIDNDRKPDYKTALGQRHKWLREEVLKLTLRGMTEFYEFNKVSELESYENGQSELPLYSLKKVEGFFFLNPEFLELGKKPIFSSFRLRREIVLEYFDNGFHPLIACCPSDREDLLCYILFYREELGFIRVIVSDRPGSFVSHGGGRMNIEYLINEMIDRDIDPYQIRILKAGLSDWEAIESNNFYSKNILVYFGQADWECMDIFYSWYEESLAIQKKWAKNA